MSFQNPLIKSKFIQSALFNLVLMCSLVNSVLTKILGDFNTKESAPVLAQFLRDDYAVNIIHKNICSKSINNPSSIDLLLLTVLIVFEIRQLSAHGYLTFINLR